MTHKPAAADSEEQREKPGSADDGVSPRRSPRLAPPPPDEGATPARQRERADATTQVQWPSVIFSRRQSQ